MKRRKTLQTSWLYERTEVCWLMLNRGRRPKMTRNRWVKKCFHTPHSTWLKNSMSHFEPDAAQTFSSLVSDCVTTILSRSSFSPPLHCQWSSSAAVWLLTIKLRISALFLMLGHYHKCNNVPTHAGIFFHFRVMARSPSSVTSQGRGCTSCMTITPWIAWQRGTSNSHQGSVWFYIINSQQTLN